MNTGVWKRSARSKASLAMWKHSLGLAGNSRMCLVSPWRGVGAGQDVPLLGARRHAGRRAGPLHVDDHRRDLGVVGQADQLAHQRDARPGGGGEGARAVPGRADHHADRRQLVLGLQDAEVALAGLGILAVLLAERLERVHHRGGRRDRVPGGHRGARRTRSRARWRCCRRSGSCRCAVGVHLLAGGWAAGRTGCRSRSRSPGGSPCGSTPSAPSCARTSPPAACRSPPCRCRAAPPARRRRRCSSSGCARAARRTPRCTAGPAARPGT